MPVRCLGALEAEQLEEPMRIAQGNAPLGVVVGGVERISSGPGAPVHRPSTMPAMMK